jgi:hypothetical protein
MSTSEERQRLIMEFRNYPNKLEALVKDLSSEQLTTRYIANEWTVAQNVHHVADSHLHAYLRFKWILVEDNPKLSPYFQDDWAKTGESIGADLSYSFLILRGLHERWARLAESLTEADWSRSGEYPESGRLSLEDIFESYVAHGEKHIAQIQKTLAAAK